MPVTFYPAGHIIGSSQIKVESNGEIWVLSGDYKLENDGYSGQFEPVKCHNFITKSTFGLPIYNWKPQGDIYSGIKNSIAKNQTEGKTSVLIAYSLGKAQRLLKPISEITDKIFVHGAVFNIHMTLVNAGWKLPFVQRVNPEDPKELFKGSVVIAPSRDKGLHG